MDYKWDVIGAKVTGRSHKLSNTPCQDSFQYTHYDEEQKALILTVADGHGGKRYVRSDKGSNFACQAAISCSLEYLKKVFFESDDNIIKEISKNRFTVDILKKWHELIDEDLSSNPFSEEEKIILNSDIPYKAYGTTLLIVIILSDKILAWQIGDGDIVYYNKDGGVKRIMLDDTLIGNETSSLCQKKAELEFRFHMQNTYSKETLPDLIMLSTDGYRNSFKSDEGFETAPSDYYSLIAEEGSKAVDENLNDWLNETSSCGSGDDITLLICFRI